MRAAVVAAPGRVDLVEVESPEPPVGSVLVDVEGSGVCGSNLPVWEGRPWFDYPLRPGNPGHEAWGRVQGSGQRVALLAEDAFAEQLVVPADRLVAVPDALDGRPFPGEAIACAVNAARRSDLQPGQDVAVIGVGFLGALLVALAARAGCRVIALSRKPEALDLATRMGAKEVVLLDDHQRVIDQVGRLTSGDLCPRVLEVTGAQWPLDVAGQLTGFGGRLVIAGYHQDGMRQVDVQLWNWRGIDVVNAHERDPQVQLRGLREAVELVASGVLDPDPLYTHVLPLEEAGRAMDLAATRPPGFVKALVVTS